MPFPLPTPAELTRRMEARLEAAIRAARPDASPAAVARAVRSPRGMLAILARVTAMELYEAHVHLRWWGDQYFPDTAESEQLARHASIWGIIRRPATFALGRATVAGAPGTIVPAGLQLQGAGALYEVQSAVTVGGTGAAVLDVQATVAGPDGNAASGMPLSPITLVPGLDPQQAVVDGEGITGGTAIETDGSLRTRLLAEIRAPAHGGARFDYPRWVQNQYAAAQVRCEPNWVGLGTVGVIVAMGTAAAPRVPTSAELAAMAATLEDLRPVTAEVVLVPVVLLPVAHTIVVDPYEVAVTQAVEAAVRTFFAREAVIGEPLYRSRLSEAISAAAGEYRHELTTPAANVLPTPTQLPVPGTVTLHAPS